MDDRFGAELPAIRDWTEANFSFSGYITGFTPPTAEEIPAWRAELGFRDDELLCVVAVGGSGVGRALLDKVIAAYPIAKRQLPALRMIAVAGPRIDPAQFPTHRGLEVHGSVDPLYRHLWSVRSGRVQGGLSTPWGSRGQTPFSTSPSAITSNKLPRPPRIVATGRTSWTRHHRSRHLAAASPRPRGARTYREVETGGGGRPRAAPLPPTRLNASGERASTRSTRPRQRCGSSSLTSKIQVDLVDLSSADYDRSPSATRRLSDASVGLRPDEGSAAVPAMRHPLPITAELDPLDPTAPAMLNIAGLGGRFVAMPPD